MMACEWNTTYLEENMAKTLKILPLFEKKSMAIRLYLSLTAQSKSAILILILVMLPSLFPSCSNDGISDGISSDKLEMVTFDRTYGDEHLGEVARDAIQMSDGRYFVIGESSTSPYSYELLAIKTNAQGQMDWSQSFGGEHSEKVAGVLEKAPGIMVVGGTIGEKIWILTIDLIHNQTESITLLPEERSWYDYGPRFFSPTEDGGYFLGGRAYNYNFDHTFWYVLRLNQSAGIRWYEEIEIGYIEIDDGVQTSDGDFVIVGHRLASDADNSDDLFAMKLGTSGNLVWIRYFGGDRDDERAFCVHPTPDGGIIVGGETRLDESPYRRTIPLMVQIDREGNSSFFRTYEPVGEGSIRSVLVSHDGGIVAAGTTLPEEQSDPFLLKTDSVGNVSWCRYFGQPSADTVASVRETVDGGYLLCGTTYPNDSDQTDFRVLKTDPNGLIHSE
jgi:hypothetical protein